ncbi:MAG: vWA domain-containing protein [Candidatus Marinimicrobia bacterium]|nr:vWA domain-containing protein [Candidatus Neomarinimicrobiota bacterium]
MKKKTFLRRQASKDLKLKSKEKDWLKRLENVSGSPVNLSQKQKQLYLLIDCSSSMDYCYKMQQAKNGSLTFAEEALNKGYIVGLITFSCSANLLLEPQCEILQLHKRINNIYASGSTNLTDALDIASQQLSGTMGERILCVVTDGMPNNPTYALKMSKAMHIEGIDIMSIGTDDADQEFLKQLSTRTDLSIKVNSEQLEKGIVSMAKLLPS